MNRFSLFYLGYGFEKRKTPNLAQIFASRMSLDTIFERHFRVVGRLVWIKVTSCEPSALSFNIGKKYKLNHYIQFDR